MESLMEYGEYIYSVPSKFAFELSLVAFAVWMWKKNLAESNSTRKMTDQEKAQILANFTPEPLCDDIPEDHYALNPRIVSGRIGKRITVNGKDCLNMATNNFLGLSDRPDSNEKATKALRNYGVGSCGPRGFYGTADVHLELESRLAKFMGVEEACLYSYGFSAISSAIPSYSKNHDVIFADEQVNFAIQQGITGSRSTVYYFKHNDPNDLERLLRAQDERDRKDPKKAKNVRRFLIIEGIYMNTGTLVNLREIVKLRAKYKCRLFLDETISFGVLGATGKGVREHFGVPNSEIDLIASTLEHSISSYGGFLCGSSFLMEHQRLCGLAYCFSASLPPLQAVVTLTHLDVVSEDPEIMEKLRENCKKMQNMLMEGLTHLRTDSHPLSPVKVLVLSEAEDRVVAEEKLNAIVTFAENHGVALTVFRRLPKEELLEHPPSIKLTVSSLLTESDMKSVVEVLNEACSQL
ncbi:serine palmitoyltransferase 1 [Galendromus occidentalis]|uniref:Serine palmitoyltransferase 1 n=1 Tax=Galendromus occidentalis TaxID=34638 RepID=A0AAJ6VWV4_9ACAR|nr:serine palmitoyltransferase 1 [Galendromus occidentalis]